MLSNFSILAKDASRNSCAAPPCARGFTLPMPFLLCISGSVGGKSWNCGKVREHCSEFMQRFGAQGEPQLVASTGDIRALSCRSESFLLRRTGTK